MPSTRNAAIIGMLEPILGQGMREGMFHPGLGALDVHMLINGFCFYRVSNRHTLRAIFGLDLEPPAVIA